VVGQAAAKWAYEVAAAGRHHMLFHGPGVGKEHSSLRVCQAYFLILMYAMPSKFLRCTRSLASILPTR
jgi:hypothetical protein